MSILFYTALLFLTALLIHFLVWKMHIPKKQTAALLYIFFSTLIIGIVIFNNFKNQLIIYGIFAPRILYEYIYVSILYLFLTLDYIITYTGIEADVPSVSIVMRVAHSYRRGLSRADIEEGVNENILIKPRIRDLIRDKMAYLDKDRYRLTTKGVLFIRIFIFYRNLLGLGKGG